MRFRFAYESIIRHSNAVLMIRWTGERERRREREGNSSSSSSPLNEREKRERGKKILTFERRKHGSFVECSLLEMNWYSFSFSIGMKLRSHEILSTNKNPIRSSNPSRLKQLFQRRNVFKKKSQPSPGLIHTIPDYVRKSIFRFLLEVKSPTPPPPPPPIPSTPIRPPRPPPLMGIQALKTKTQRHPPKRSLRIK